MCLSLVLAVCAFLHCKPIAAAYQSALLLFSLWSCWCKQHSLWSLSGEKQAGTCETPAALGLPLCLPPTGSLTILCCCNFYFPLASSCISLVSVVAQSRRRGLLLSPEAPRHTACHFSTHSVWETSDCSFHFQRGLLCWRNSAISFCWEWVVICFVPKGLPCSCVLSHSRQIPIIFPKQLCSSWYLSLYCCQRSNDLLFVRKIKSVSTEQHNIKPKMNGCTKLSHFGPLSANLKLPMAIGKSKWSDTWYWPHIIHAYVKVSWSGGGGVTWPALSWSAS